MEELATENWPSLTAFYSQVLCKVTGQFSTFCQRLLITPEPSQTSYSTKSFLLNSFLPFRLHLKRILFQEAFLAIPKKTQVPNASTGPSNFFYHRTALHSIFTISLNHVLIRASIMKVLTECMTQNKDSNISMVKQFPTNSSTH